MTVRVRDLLAADPEPFRRAAEAWRGLAEDLDDAAEVYIRSTRDVEQVWSHGAAAQSAQTTVARLRGEISNAYQPALRIYRALDHHAYALADLRERAQAVIQAAHEAGFRLDTASERFVPRAERPGSVDQAGLADRYTDELHALVQRARVLDTATSDAISANLPDEQVGFGGLPAREITREEVERQRGRPPKAVHQWWLGLTPEQQEQVIADYPELVGWLDGVPASDRDAANRLRLARLQDDLQRRENELLRRIEELRSRLGPLGNPLLLRFPNPFEEYLEDVLGGLPLPFGIPGELGELTRELAQVRAEQASLAKVDEALAKVGSQGLLLGVDPAGDGKVIIAVGDPDTARHTGVWVPGLGTTMDSTVGNVERMINLQQAADSLTLTPDDVATVMWLGYDAPETDLSVVLSERSRQGAEPLNQFVEGLRATHGDGSYHVTAIGHSYGSTVVGEAALTGRLQVDDIITAGSPGTHADHASELMADPRHVWAGSAPDDPVSNAVGNPYSAGLLASAGHPNNPLGGLVVAGVWAYDQAHGPSPHYPGFGANQYVVDTSGHSDYWQPGSESLRNQARVIVGKYSWVGLEHGQSPPDLS